MSLYIIQFFFPYNPDHSVTSQSLHFTISISNTTILPPQLTHSPIDTSCHHGGIYSSIQLHCTICHCAPVSTQKAISIVPLSLLRRQFPLCPCLYSEGNFPCAPVSTQKASVQNNYRLAYRQLSSRDGTYIIQCHAMLTIHYNISISFNISIIPATHHYSSI